MAMMIQHYGGGFKVTEKLTREMFDDKNAGDDEDDDNDEDAGGVGD